MPFSRFPAFHAHAEHQFDPHVADGNVTILDGTLNCNQNGKVSKKKRIQILKKFYKIFFKNYNNLKTII